MAKPYFTSLSEGELLLVMPSTVESFIWGFKLCHRDSIGDSTISGDLRWAGFLGVNVDFVARSHCAVEFISLEDMKVSLQY